jgi:outer membrane receptor protein involved in Fe transport
MKTTSYRQHKLAIAVAATLGVAVPASVSAQTVLEEVIVTAQKREQSLQDVPIAVSAFSGEMIKQSGVKDMFDLQANAPSLIVGQTQNSSTTTFSIRGIFTSSQNFGLEPSVGLYVDGVYRARQSSMINNLVDIASVEVLRGPQGTLFGRNTPAGAIQLNTVGADFEGSGFLEATAGDYDLYSASGAKSLTLIENVLAVRATGFVMNRDGYVDIVNGDDDAINDRDRWGARFQALYTPNDSLTFRFIGDYSEVNETCCAVGSWKNNFFPQDGATSPESGTDATAVALGSTVVDQRDFYDYKVAVSRKPVSENEDKGVSLKIDWETDNFANTIPSMTSTSCLPTWTPPTSRTMPARTSSPRSCGLPVRARSSVTSPACTTIPRTWTTTGLLQSAVICPPCSDSRPTPSSMAVVPTMSTNRNTKVMRHSARRTTTSRTAWCSLRDCAGPMKTRT